MHYSKGHFHSTWYKINGPGTYAGCERNLINIIGMPVDFHAWEKLPFREPSERISRVYEESNGFDNPLHRRNASKELRTNCTYRSAC